MIKKINFLIIIQFIFLTFIPIVNAKNNNIVDFSKKGQLSIILKSEDDNLLLEGVEVRLYQVANASLENNNLVFNYLEGFSSCDVDINNLSNKIIPTKLKNCLIESESKFETLTTDKKGKVKFKDLDLGLYLVTQMNELNNEYRFEPFLVMIPKDINNNWIYEIEATPKTDIYKLMDLKVQKMWFNMYYEIPEQIEVALLKGEDVVDTVVLNNDNNWTYVFKDIEASDDYKVLELNVPKGFKVVYKEYADVYMIINIDYLAQTGQDIILMVSLLVLGLVFILIGLYFEKRKKYE